MKPSDIALLLPEVLRTGSGAASVLATLLEVMSAQHARSEQILDQLDAIFDPRRTPDRFVPMLARWVDLGRLLSRSAAEGIDATQGDALSTGTGALRELVASAAFLSQWRGTHDGLIAFLERATSTRGFQVDEQVPGDDGQARPFHFRLSAPASLRREQALLERIVQSEKPAHVTCEILFNLEGA